MEAATFEEYLLKKGHTKQTVKSYLFSATPFIDMNPDLNSFTFKSVTQALNNHLKHHKNQNYKNAILAAIKKYYDYLMETGQRSNHPCRTLRFKAIRKKGMIHTDLFTFSELEMLLEREERFPALQKRNQVVVSLLIYQALQSQEIENLKVQHINLDEGRVYVKESKSGSRRHLELHPKQYKIFESYINESRKELLKIESDKLIVGSRGTAVSKDLVHYLVSTFKPLFPDRNLTPETIRQSVISNWINERRFPLEQVQLMAGHRWISTTERYRQTPADEKRLIINRLHPLA
jgi:site-specific recombinase XerD